MNTEPATRAAGQPVPPSMVLRPEEIERFDRGNGVVTIPFLGKWNAGDNKVTTGMTVFARGTGIPLPRTTSKRAEDYTRIKHVMSYIGT